MHYSNFIVSLRFAPRWLRPHPPEILPRLALWATGSEAVVGVINLVSLEAFYTPLETLPESIVNLTNVRFLRFARDIELPDWYWEWEWEEISETDSNPETDGLIVNLTAQVILKKACLKMKSNL